MSQSTRVIQKSTRFGVFQRDRFTCRYCGRKPPEATLELDHVTPFSKGGSNEADNLVTSCRECNAGKRDREFDAILLPRKADGPPRHEPAPWEDHATQEETDRLEILRRRLWLINVRRKEHNEEMHRIMRRCIARHRRKKGIQK